MRKKRFQGVMKVPGASVTGVSSQKLEDIREQLYGEKNGGIN